jgi:hypothetical protein
MRDVILKVDALQQAKRSLQKIAWISVKKETYFPIEYIVNFLDQKIMVKFSSQNSTKATMYMEPWSKKRGTILKDLGIKCGDTITFYIDNKA